MVNALVMPTGGDGQASPASPPPPGTPSNSAAPSATSSRRPASSPTGPSPATSASPSNSPAQDRRPRSRPRIAELLKLVGLTPDLGTRYPWQLSGGQRQRVGLARALANDPAILLMDEPFGALDPITRAEMQSMVKDLFARVSKTGAKTVLLVTHDLDEALFLAQRIVFLDAGNIMADLASPDVLASQIPYVQQYVAAVIAASSPDRRTPA